MRLPAFATGAADARRLGVALAACALPFLATGEPERLSIIPEAEAVTRFRLHDRLEAYRERGLWPASSRLVEVFDGDLALLKERLHPDITVPDLSELDAEEFLLPRIRPGQPIMATYRRYQRRDRTRRLTWGS